MKELCDIKQISYAGIAKGRITMKSGRFNGNVVTYISAAMAVMMITGQTGITTYATGEAEGTEDSFSLDANVSDGNAEEEKEIKWKDTGLVKNGDFENGDTTGWDVSFEGADGDVSGYKIKMDEWAKNNTTSFFNYWNNNSEAEEMSLSQTISGVSAGTYKLCFDADGAEADSGLAATVSGVSWNITTCGWDNWSTYETEAFTLTDEMTDLTIAFSGHINSSYWGDIDNVRLYTVNNSSNEGSDDGSDQNDTPDETENNQNDEEDTQMDNQDPVQDEPAVEAEIFVNKVEGCDENFITGVDVSSYVALKNGGVKYYDYDGNELDDQGYFNFLHDCGVNYVRIRVWNDPYDENGNGYGGGTCDLAKAIQIGQWATGAGMKVLIDFHYSDFWADPGKQTAPKAWKNMDVDAKATTLKQFTIDSLKDLINSGVNVGMVQVGNETNNGIAGEKSWDGMLKMFAAGAEAVREVSKDILVAVHFTNPEGGRYDYYASQLKNVDYDVFASSYYPYWHGTLDNLKNELSAIANNYGKKVMVTETSYVYTLDDADGCANTETQEDYDAGKEPFNFDVSPQGQADSVRGVVDAVASIENGIGVFYWEPAWLPVNMHGESGDEVAISIEANKDNWENYGTGWASSYARDYDIGVQEYGGGGAVVENEAWFDFYGHPLASAKMYSYMRTGAKAKLRLNGVDVNAVEAVIDEEIKLPETGTAKYNDGTTKEVNIVWSEEDIKTAMESGAGVYMISGTADVDGGVAVSCKLTIKPMNFLANPGFEEGDKGWTITSDVSTSEIAIKQDSSNVHTGEWCMKFWYGTAFKFNVEQEVTLNKGIYSLSAFVEGGDAGENDEFKLYAILNGEEKSAQAGVTKWQEFQNPTIDNIEITDDGTRLTIGASTNASAGCWGAWDDFALWKTGEIASAPEKVDTDDKQDNSADINDAQPSQRTVVNDEKATTVKAQSESEVVKVTKVKLNKKKKTLKIGKKYKLKATVKPYNATNQKVSWKSSNKKVARVSRSGKVTAVSKGKATITVTTKDGKFKAKCKIIVK